MKNWQEIEQLLINIAQILDVVKQEWGEEWSEFDQQQRDHIAKLLKSATQPSEEAAKEALIRLLGLAENCGAWNEQEIETLPEFINARAAIDAARARRANEREEMGVDAD